MCGSESAAAGEEAADHPLPQSQEPGVQPQTAEAAAAAGRSAAGQTRTEHRGESINRLTSSQRVLMFSCETLMLPFILL